MNTQLPIILASGSPRRAQLLADMGYQFSVKTKSTDESWPQSLPVREVAAYLARKKSLAFTQEAETQIVITADTTVCLDNDILNKAADEQEAQSMLLSLSGQTHQVVTGVCVRYQQTELVMSSVADVRFRTLTDHEIDHYIRTFKPFDKAGAYGIQEWIGMIGITELKGSFYTVMGLPTHLVYEMIAKVSA